MANLLLQNARIYAAQHRLRLAEPLGFGVHGSVFVTENNPKAGDTALKVLREAKPYRRERDVYLRLKQTAVTEILGFKVPQLIGFDDDLLAIEMTIVTRPFLLDFAGAYLDSFPEFSPEVWVDWEIEKREQFGPRWSTVRRVLAALEELDIHVIDVTPSNIGFREDQIIS